MQLACVTNVPEFEVKAFANLSKQYFYMQYIEKSKLYQTRYLRGMLENPDSCQRKIVVGLFYNRMRLKAKNNKYERIGFRVSRLEEHKYIDCTDDYKKALAIINDSKEISLRDSFDSTKKQLSEYARRVGGRITRISTPVERAVIASPSKNKSDMMLLPGYSL